VNLKYEYIATGRQESMFANDIENKRSLLLDKIRNSRIVIVGAAGSIGSSVVKTLVKYQPKSLVLIDVSENNIVELVRDLRSTEELVLPDDFSTLPIAMGSLEFNRFFREQKPFDFFFNLAAIKHVRSEKDIYCIMRMVDTNVLFLHEFLSQNDYLFKKVFSVSSDKAANPGNLMGATKMAMEQALVLRSEIQPFSTARFANVAFSDGSLPYGFLQRIISQQPLSAPEDVKRYFISHQEAGELCILSAMTGENGDTFFPKMSVVKDEKTFSNIAVELLSTIGYEPFLCASEDEAKGRCQELISQNKWPCYFFKTDTTGEKSFEEFYTADEKLDLESFRNIGVVKRDLDKSTQIEKFMDFAKKAKTCPNINKTEYIKQISKVVPGLCHVETGKNLDQKM
jgi:FlaA1/EpsC-like NDP-sugar epimerase